MENEKINLVKAWLIKARNDLATAAKVAKGPDPYLDTAVFHCQQSFEKAIKGFLVYYDIRFDKTHNLRTLLGLALPVNPQFSAWFDAADILTPYAVEFRYPGDVLEPTPEEFKQANEMADNFFQFILSLLPPETNPHPIVNPNSLD